MAEEYVPLSYFKDNDLDRSSYPVRDYPRGKKEFAVKCEPNNLTFTGTSDPQTVLVTNTGFSPLTIQAIVVGDFERVGAAQTSVEAGATIAIQVRCKNTNDNDSTGALIINGAHDVRDFVVLNQDVE